MRPNGRSVRPHGPNRRAGAASRDTCPSRGSPHHSDVWMPSWHPTRSRQAWRCGRLFPPALAPDANDPICLSSLVVRASEPPLSARLEA